MSEDVNARSVALGDNGTLRNPDSESSREYVYPKSEGQASIAAIRAVAEIKGVDPLEMEPVYDGQNVEVLDQVFEWQQLDNVAVDGPVTVEIADHQVSLHTDGTLEIDPPE